MSETTTRPRRLSFGLNDEIPEGKAVAWGARFIFPDDMVFDRQDFLGIDTPEGQRLKKWLDGPKGAIAQAKAGARSAAASTLGMADDKVVVLFEDEFGVVKGNPKASHGYLYVVAYLK